jgi:hypothetical protein
MIVESKTPFWGLLAFLVVIKLIKFIYVFFVCEVNGDKEVIITSPPFYSIKHIK